MYKNKKVICVPLAILLVFALLLPGCGNTKDQPQAGEKTEITGAQAPQTELEPVQLKWYVAGAEPKEKNLVEEEMSKQIKDRINASISLNWIDYGNYKDKMNVLLASGDDFDLCFGGNWVGWYQMVAKGAFADIKDMLPKVAPKLRDAISQQFWDACTVKGKIVGIPNIQPTAQQIGILIANKAYVEKSGFVDKIKTYDDYIKYVEATYNKEKDNPDFKPLSMGVNTIDDIFPWLDFVAIGDVTAVGVIDMRGDKTKVVNQFETDTYKSLLKQRREYFQKGWIRKDIVVYRKNRDQVLNDMKSGKLIIGEFAGYGPNIVGNMRTVEGTGVELAYFDIGCKKYLTTSAITATVTSINKSSKNFERALMFMELMNTDQKLYNTMCYGVEGKHYDLVDGKVSIPEELKGKSGYAPNSNWQFGMTKNAYPNVNDPEWLLEMAKDWDTKDIVDVPILGFSFDSEPVKAELSKCATVLAEYQAALEFGTVDVDKVYPEFINKLKEAGADKIIAEQQRQLDEFMASKK